MSVLSLVLVFVEPYKKHNSKTNLQHAGHNQKERRQSHREKRKVNQTHRRLSTQRHKTVTQQHTGRRLRYTQRKSKHTLGGRNKTKTIRCNTRFSTQEQ